MSPRSARSYQLATYNPLFMMDYEPAYSRLALARLAQRNAALFVDFIACAFLGQLIEALLGLSNSGLGLTIFGIAWLINRVIVAGKNQGQSLGRWLLSIRVVDMTYGKTAGVLELLKREAVIYLGMAFVLAGFNYGGLTNTISLFALIPIIADGVIALADSERMQTLHDRLASTIVIACRKGLQLDQKITKLFGQASRTASKAYQSSRDRRMGYSQDYNRGYSQDFDEYDEFGSDDGWGGRDDRQTYDDRRYNEEPYPQSRPKRGSQNPYSQDRYEQSYGRAPRQDRQDRFDDWVDDEDLDTEGNWGNRVNNRGIDRYTPNYNEDAYGESDRWQQSEPRFEAPQNSRRPNKKKKSRKPRF
jgi:uncharacterized RDD family membrane protein YckC